MLQNIHSYVAYAVLLLVIAALLNSIIGFTSNKKYSDKNKKVYLFALIASHIQLLIGLAWYFMSPKLAAFREAGGIMKNSEARNALVEHPVAMLIAIVLITIGFSKHKKKAEDKSKFKTVMVFYGIALLLILVKIPWKLWLAS